MTAKRERKKRERARRGTTSSPPKPAPPTTRARRLRDETAERARRAASDVIRQPDLGTRTAELAGAARSLALQVISQSPLSGRHECKAGCAFCCHTAVTIAPPEAFAIAAYLRANYSESDLADVRERLDRNAELASSMTRDDYIARNVPCALLTQDGRCRVHAVRPMACAGFLSTSRTACEAEFKHLAGRDRVPTDKYAMLAGLGASYGLKEACRQSGLDGQFYELHHILRRVLDDPDAAQRWARGDQLFDGCLT